MNPIVYIDLILNLSLLIAMTILSGFIEKKLPRTTSTGKIIQGLLFGMACLFGMLRPLVLGPGLIFDGRSVLIGLCALFFGPLAAAVTISIPLVYRLSLGGPGVLMGILVILESALVGMLARRQKKPEDQKPSIARLYVIGLLIHVLMLVLTLTILDGSGPQVLRNIGPTVIIAYPLAFILAGKILSDQLEIRSSLQALKQSEERFQLAMDATSDGLWDLTIPTDESYYSPSYFRILGYEPNEFPLTGRTWSDLLHPEDKAAALLINKACIEGKQDYIDHEFRMRCKDGSWKWIHSRGKCVERNAAGQATRLVGTHIDISARKLLEESLRRSIQEKEILIREVHHRVKNNMTIVSSLLNLQEEAIQKPEDAILAFRNSNNRIFAMALVHNELYNASDYTKVDMNLYLHNLTDSIQSHNTMPPGVHLIIACADISLALDTAISCGLIYNELITNSLRHAFPDRRTGYIKIRLQRSTKGLQLSVADNGVGLPDDYDSVRPLSLGLSLVKILVDQLGGTLERVDPPETGFCIEIPDRA